MNLVIKKMSKSCYYFPKQQLYNRFHSNLNNNRVIFEVFMNRVALDDEGKNHLGPANLAQVHEFQQLGGMVLG